MEQGSWNNNGGWDNNSQNNNSNYGNQGNQGNMGGYSQPPPPGQGLLFHIFIYSRQSNKKSRAYFVCCNVASQENFLVSLV